MASFPGLELLATAVVALDEQLTVRYANPAAELATAVATFFPDVPKDILANSLGRYKDAGLWSRQRRRETHRSRRPRRACFGELVQMDASIHDWLEGRGESLVADDFWHRHFCRRHRSDRDPGVAGNLRSRRA